MGIVCSQCGTENPDRAQFCAKCGRKFETIASEPKEQEPYYGAPKNKLVRCSNDQVIAGICAGLAFYFDMDVSLVRILTVLAFILTGSAAFWLYVIAWIIIPEAPCPTQY